MTGPGPNGLPGNIPGEHPGTKEPVKNPNPRANENLPDQEEAAANEYDSIDEVGTEITDGEDG